MLTVYIVIDSWDVGMLPDLYVFSTEEKAKAKYEEIKTLLGNACALSIIEEQIDKVSV